jgi:ribosome-binding protein aMBF1 (putative translation factor)
MEFVQVQTLNFYTFFPLHAAKNKRAMSKFLLTGVLLVLLASFLHYPTSSTNKEDRTPQRNEVMMVHISEQVKLARLERRLSQKDLANRVGLTKLDVEKIEAGQVVPTRDLLFKIEQALNTSLTMENY